MKQIVIFERIERVELELEVPQPLAAATLGELANASLGGIGGPAFGRQLMHKLSGWKPVRVEPQCECPGAKTRTPAKPAKRRGRK